MRKIRICFRWWHALWVSVFAFVVLALTTNVSTLLTPEDTVAIKAILGVQQKPTIQSFDDEIRFIFLAQAQALKAAPAMEGIPDYMDRQPMDLLKAQSGLCYDRSARWTRCWLG